MCESKERISVELSEGILAKVSTSVGVAWFQPD